MRTTSILAAGAAFLASFALAAPAAQAGTAPAAKPVPVAVAPASFGALAEPFSCSVAPERRNTFKAIETVLVKDRPRNNATNLGQINRNATKIGCKGTTLGDTYTACDVTSNGWVTVNWSGLKGYVKQTCTQVVGSS
ncbi:hypothetical protein [Streptomyces qinzhouensis]|uniref:SH3 domain-containing protein n=1 Tax=Streptomyces qinzhouensis TaxID=2599401 RepID=A0A5B8J9P7_9ACTN|nr:hypothetical protein [Streptomyces qinzhouensis]QDY77124.1 hypothetical protein FQU76_12025 [Streptomyces qinzhouensis]